MCWRGGWRCEELGICVLRVTHRRAQTWQRHELQEQRLKTFDIVTPTTVIVIVARDREGSRNVVLQAVEA